MKTNEELALQIKQGKTEYLEELWCNVMRLVELRTQRYANFIDYHDDMMQEAYLLLQKAAEEFDENKGMPFINWYVTYYVPDAFKMAIYGGRSEAKMNDPTRKALGLDVPLDDDEEINLLDSIIDIHGEEIHRAIEQRSFLDDLSQLILKCISRLDSERAKDIIIYHYEHDSTFKEGSEVLGIPYVKYMTAWNSGCNQIRHQLMRLPKTDKERYELERFTRTERTAGTGLESWKRNGFTSSTEKIALKNIEEETLRKNVKTIQKLVLKDD